MAPLFIAHIDAERAFSGGEVQALLLIEALAGRGHRNLLICPPRSALAAAAERRGIATRTVSMRSDLDPAALWNLVRELRALPPTPVVHAHTGRAAWLGSWAASRAGLPAVVTRRMDRPVRPGTRTRLIYQRWTQRTAAISPHVAAQLIAAGVPESRLSVIPDAVDPARVHSPRGRAAVRNTAEVADGDVVLLAAARLVHRKGLDLVLDALAQLATEGLHPRFWIAGDGPERAALEAQAQRAGLTAQVSWLGQRDDIGDLLAGCDAVVLASRAEGLGVAALEAMAAGRPLVASAVGGLAEAVVDEQTGLLVPPGDVTALAAALRRVVSQPALRQRLGGAGPAQVAAHFHPTAMADAYERLYAAAMAEHAR
jgi:glycosyltransferase involved in cell wall biosynthesis